MRGEVVVHAKEQTRGHVEVTVDVVQLEEQEVVDNTTGCDDSLHSRAQWWLPT